MNPLSFFHLLNVGGIQKTIEIYVFNSFFISIVLFLLHVYVGSGIYMYIYTDQRKRKKYIIKSSVRFKVSCITETPSTNMSKFDLLFLKIANRTLK